MIVTLCVIIARLTFYITVTSVCCFIAALKVQDIQLVEESQSRNSRFFMMLYSVLVLVFYFFTQGGTFSESVHTFYSRLEISYLSFPRSYRKYGAREQYLCASVHLPLPISSKVVSIRIFSRLYFICFPCLISDCLCFGLLIALAFV